MSSYKDMKNYIHNDCGISKEYIKHEFERLLKEKIDKTLYKTLFVDYYYYDRDMDKVINDKIHNENKILNDTESRVPTIENINEKVIDNKIEQCVNDNERLQNIIEGEVRRQVSELLRVNSFFGSYYRKNSLQASIATFYDEVHRKLKENILDNVEITFKDSDKE